MPCPYEAADVLEAGESRGRLLWERLEGNGHKDLVALTTTGETLVFLGNGKGSFTREKTPPPAYPGACRGAHVELADLDGDGREELVEAFSDEPDEYGHCPSDGGLTAWKAGPRTGARRLTPARKRTFHNHPRPDCLDAILGRKVSRIVGKYRCHRIGWILSL